MDLYERLRQSARLVRDLMAGLRLVGHHDQLSRQNVTKQSLFSALDNRQVIDYEAVVILPARWYAIS
jgi:hypothetical protein